jgi:SpoVK/Ycf46/Vps4 family AAA+-type ATPase
MRSIKPEDCSNTIFSASGIRFEDDIAVDMWQKIMDHKWILSEKLAREVGFQAACIDFLDTFKVDAEVIRNRQVDLLDDLRAQYIEKDVWDTISDTQPPKQLVNKRIILPLIEERLSKKHGVIPPSALIFFGPPGTGKTHFARAMAGALGWWFIEISPSLLMADGMDKIGANMQATMEKVRKLDEVVVFIDEFEEIAASRDDASRIDRSITNEFLKQVPLLKHQENKILLVCATNYIRQLDAALLRPGRFDCIIPVGSLDDEGRKTILQHYNSKINARDINLDLIVSLTQNFTPADIGLLYQIIAQRSFEQEYEMKKDCVVTTEAIIAEISKFRPSLTHEMIEEFSQDVIKYSRT